MHLECFVATNQIVAELLAVVDAGAVDDQTYLPLRTKTTKVLIWIVDGTNVEKVMMKRFACT